VTWWIFHWHFNIHWNNTVPSHNTVLLWVRNFIETVSAAKTKPSGRGPSLRTPENIERLRQAFVRSSPRSASRNAIALRMSDRTVRQILNEDLNFHPYKMVRVQAINDQNTVNQKTHCEVLLNILDNDDLNHVLMTDDANFHLCGNVNSQNCCYWATRTLTIFTRNLYIPRRLLLGVVWHFWGDWPLFLWRRGRQGSNSKFSLLHWDALHISRTRVAVTWCWNPDSLVSARQGNSSHCEDCNASPQRDVISSRDLMKRE